MSIQVDGQYLENVIELENFLEMNTPDVITIIKDRSKREYTWMPAVGQYNCQYLSYPVQYGVGLPRAGHCGNMSKEEVVANVREMLPAAGGKRKSRARKTRKSPARKSRSRKSRA
jgi:hypothetical protein